MTTDAERLRAAGHTVTLATGEYPLVYDFAAVLELEKSLGSVGAITSRLSWRGPVASTINTFLQAGLRREALSAQEIQDGVLLDRLKEYQEAIEAAVVEAFPPPPKDGQGNGSSPGMSSPGPTTTTTAPSATDEVTTGSGA